MPSLFDQRYTTDAVGNTRSIDRAVGADRFFATYAYQDPQYFLTEGNGPWGRRAWTYDRIGNRLSEGAVYEDGDLPPEVFGYTYEPNASGGNTPKLSQIEPAPGGEPGSFLTYGYDAAGGQTAVEQIGAECSGRTSFLDYSAERRLSRLRTTDGTGTTDLAYDGRGFLRRSRLSFSDSNDFIQTEPVYSSDGLLFARKFHHQNTRKGPGDGGSATHPVTQHTTSLFYFAGRPVAQLRQFQAGGGPDELLFITTDHLGVPILATDAAGAQVWAGGLDPFGQPFVFPRTGSGDDEDPPGPPDDGDGGGGGGGEEEGLEATSLAMETLGLFLRFPGQWDDPSFQSHGLRVGLYYNVHRWYEPGIGRYTRPDPLTLHDKDFTAVRAGTNPFAYANSRPTTHIDRLGLVTSDTLNCLFNPIECGRVSDCRSKTEKATQSHWPGMAALEHHNNEADAYRHCYWSCCMAKSIGRESAEKWGTGHENFSTNPRCEMRQDLYNNAIGRGTGPSGPAATCDAHCSSGPLMRKPPGECCPAGRYRPLSN